MTDKPSSPFVGLDKALLRSTQRPAPPSESTRAETAPEEQSVPARKTPQRDSRTSRQPPSGTASPPASALARYPVSTPVGPIANSYADAQTIDAIRKIVKSPGKEVSFIRLTGDEKAQLAEIVYAYKRRGHRTTENEINRIAVNFILADYRAHGANSVLAKVLAALIA